MKIISHVLESENWIRQLYLFFFGLYLILFPNLGFRLLMIVLIGLLITLGMYHLFRFFYKKKKVSVYTIYGLLGILQIVIGLIMYLNLEWITNISLFLLIFFCFFNSASNIKEILVQKTSQSKIFKICLLLVILNIGLGITLLISPFQLITSKPIFLGFALIIINGLDLYKGNSLKIRSEK